MLVILPCSRTLARRVPVAIAAVLLLLLLFGSIGTWAATEPDRGVLEAFGGSQSADSRIGMLPAVQIGESTNRRLTLRVQFGAPQLQRLTVGGTVFTQVTIPGLEAGSAAAGAPALPVWRQLIAVPRGARARISSARPVVSDRFPVTLYPYQPFAGESSLDVDKFVDQPPPQDAYEGPAFAFDPRAYRPGTTIPTDPCQLTACR